jgi:hypothetical protein
MIRKKQNSGSLLNQFFPINENVSGRPQLKTDQQISMSSRPTPSNPVTSFQKGVRRKNRGFLIGRMVVGAGFEPAKAEFPF